jgi:hypothetical protein
MCERLLYIPIPRFVSSLSNRDLTQHMPASLAAPLQRLLFCSQAPDASTLGSGRMSVDDFLQSEFFRDVLIRTLRYLDTILDKDLDVRLFLA